MGHFGRTFLLMNEENLFSVKDWTHTNYLLTSMFCSRYWTALICDRIQRSLRKPWLNGKNCSSCECPCDLVRVPILGNSSVFCIVTFYKAYVFCYFVVFLWRTKPRLVYMYSGYIIETQEKHQKWSRFVETAFPAHFIPCVSFDAWHSFLQGCDVASLMFWITIFSVRFIMICT